jgi:predicted GNAT superfamily acetyltransferase
MVSDALRDVSGSLRDEETARARAAAERVMRAAGVQVRPAELTTDIQGVREILDAVFRPVPGESEASPYLLMALAHTGQYLVLAHPREAGSPPALGTSLGFFCAPARRTLHSHATAVLAGNRGRQIGWALKLHQRAWAMERGVDTITWTFDPLIRRNAWFNLVKLGARPTAFAVNFYGAIVDAVNAGDETDRFVLSWPLRSERVVAACGGSPSVPAVPGMLTGGVPRLLETGPDGDPVRAGVPRGAQSGLVQVPPDIESMRAADPALGLRWRRALRAVLTEARDQGLAIVSMGRDGWYVLAPAPGGQDAG